MLYIKPDAVKFLEQLTEKDYRIVSDPISRLECGWPPEGDLERLYDSRYRMHVARRYTIFLEHEGNDTTVLKIMTIQQAHKRYGRI
jgi:mRNA-degrading endonuclease RelE of RelBE toxin-antitoxin system